MEEKKSPENLKIDRSNDLLRIESKSAALYRFSEIIDISSLRDLLEYFYKTTGISNALLEPDGTILIRIGWQDICTNFHRIHPMTKQRCLESDLYFQSHLQDKPYVLYQCQNGLVDVAIPIIVEGAYLATFYMGQFFFEKPDEELFRKQARTMGFDWPAYRATLQKVPVFSHEKIEAAIQYNLKFIQMFAEQGLYQKKLQELNTQLDGANKSLNQKIVEYQRARDDIHELNEELEQRVKERTAQLTSANQELEAFSYSVSHDLRTPIRSIDGFSQLLEEEYAPQLGQTGKDYIHRVRSATRRMGQLIDDLLSLSHLTRREMNCRKTDLSQIARNIADDLMRLEMERGVEFVIAPNLIVFADEHLMYIVMENLIKNAWKFTRKEAHAQIEVGTFQQDDKTVFFIRDNGVGFDMTYAGKLFGAFQRLHSIQEFEGTGIGLATVHRVIRRHGGRIWAEGKINQGSTFYFSI